MSQHEHWRSSEHGRGWLALSRSSSGVTEGEGEQGLCSLGVVHDKLKAAKGGGEEGSGERDNARVRRGAVAVNGVLLVLLVPKDVEDGGRACRWRQLIKALLASHCGGVGVLGDLEPGSGRGGGERGHDS